MNVNGGKLMAELVDSHVYTNGIRQHRRGAAAVLTLDRGRSLNALTPQMLAQLDQCYRAIARDAGLYVVVLKSADPRAFSAGGDVRALSVLAKADLPSAVAALRAEYGLNWLHECFSKPTVALIDGMVMGSGVGVCAYATHRIAGPRYSFSMPETAIGFFPDVGVAHAFARMPHHIGRYLGLTGHAIGRADAYALGLVTHTIEAEQFDEIEVSLSDAWPVDDLLDRLHRDPGPGVLEAHAATIENCFSASTVEEIMAKLADVRGDCEAFARRSLSDLATRSPIALKVTLRHVIEAAARDLRQTLEVDFRLACRFLEVSDFHEGVRAALIDKDQKPAWQPATLADVTQNRLDDMFAAMPGRESNLPLRQEMQALRV